MAAMPGETRRLSQHRNTLTMLPRAPLCPLAAGIRCLTAIIRKRSGRLRQCKKKKKKTLYNFITMHSVDLRILKRHICHLLSQSSIRPRKQTLHVKSQKSYKADGGRKNKSPAPGCGRGKGITHVGAGVAGRGPPLRSRDVFPPRAPGPVTRMLTPLLVREKAKPGVWEERSAGPAAGPAWQR